MTFIVGCFLCIWRNSTATPSRRAKRPPLFGKREKQRNNSLPIRGGLRADLEAVAVGAEAGFRTVSVMTAAEASRTG